MKRSSVFVLCIVLIVGCNSKPTDDVWLARAIAGSYSLQPKPEPFYEDWFSSDNVTGWNYDDPYDPTIVLSSDSSFIILGNGGSFEMASYNGFWWISNDTITLQPWYQFFGSFDQNAESLDLMWTEVYLIQSEGQLEVLESQLFDKGRTLMRR